jgi:hypothetical protein
MLTASFDAGSRTLTWTATYTGLSGPATAAHFHGPAAPGANAGVVLPFPSAASPIQGTATLTEAQAIDLLAGRWYVNIHTADQSRRRDPRPSSAAVAPPSNGIERVG